MVENLPRIVQLYHGTPNELTPPIRHDNPNRHMEYKTDFGRGFYATTDENYARIIAATGSKRDKSSPDNTYLYLLEVDLGALRGFTFPEADLNWVLFVAFNRQKLKPSMAPELCGKYCQMLKEYDFIVGPAADDKTYPFLGPFFQPSLDITVRSPNHRLLLHCLRETAPAVQYAFLTQKAYDAIVIKNHGPELITDKDKAWLKDEADRRAVENNRKVCEYIASYGDIVPGLTFAEIVEYSGRNGWSLDVFKEHEEQLISDKDAALAERRKQWLASGGKGDGQDG